MPFEIPKRVMSATHISDVKCICPLKVDIRLYIHAPQFLVLLKTHEEYRLYYTVKCAVKVMHCGYALCHFTCIYILCQNAKIIRCSSYKYIHEKFLSITIIFFNMQYYV